ncbi:hypothetical protein K1719_003720 [Acacia pycnantha]|nr:hypothetical protein K1719_023053 [Acacia pycnantha]KAI9125104.1 hypothetical protein K1719_003720 [Acacia pycnantha]
MTSYKGPAGEIDRWAASRKLQKMQSVDLVGKGPSVDCCPWFDSSDLEVLASDDDQGALTTNSDELFDS